MERVVGTLFALTLIGSHGRASAEPLPSRDRVHESRAKGATEPSKGLPGLEETLGQLDRLSSRLLELADSDGDARVTRTEFQNLVERHVGAKVRARFGKLDRDADGRVTRAEVPTMDGARFARFDLNRDGGFTAGELTTVLRVQVTRRCTAMLARYDVDGDGALSASDSALANGEQRLTKLVQTDVQASASGGE
jgi:Ca2+-binding EF-hand superfamily protein